MTTAMVLMLCERTAIVSVAQALAEIPGVAEVYSVSGRYDLVAIVRLRNEDDLADLVTAKLVQVEGITRTETLVAFRAYSSRDLGQAFGLGFDRVEPS